MAAVGMLASALCCYLLLRKKEVDIEYPDDDAYGIYAGVKATFKITKLAKKGTYQAVIKYNGNSYYSKVIKNIKIKLRWRRCRLHN